MADARLAVHVEHLVTDYGLWCTDCNLGSGARVWVTVRFLNHMELRHHEVCADCGGKSVTD